jgi:hypothetical protein
VALVTGAARGIGRGIDAPALLMPSCLQVFENIQCWKLVSESSLSRKLRELEDK